MALFPYEPRPAGQDYLWYPASQAQQNAIHSPAEMMLFGGSAGSLKTSLLISDACQLRDNRNYVALFLRGSFPQLQKNIIPSMRELYSQMGAHYVEGVKRVWTFPSGARIYLGVIAKDADIVNVQGNPFARLYVDEVGNHPEHHVRDILPWWRTTDPTIPKAIRLSANPGGIGAPWLQSVFLRNHCPIHQPDKSVEPGALYRGSRWHSDGKLIPYTVQFIPGKLTDHNLLGDDYAESLKSQRGERSEHLLNGCWCRLEGAYFSFLRPEYVVPYQSIGDAWWWNHFISIDFGYGSSAAAAGFYGVSEAQKIYKIGELVERKMSSVDFSELICEKWVTNRKPYNGERPRITVCYMDPAMDQHSGAGRSNLEIMSEVFEKHDITVVRASKSRIANAQRLVRALNSYEFVVTDSCPMTYKSLTTRMHSDRDGDVKKVHGDELDDIYDECLVKGTLIATAQGDVAIEDIQVGDLVHTRDGLRSVCSAGMTKEIAQTITVELSDGNIITGTGNHPIFVIGKGFIRLDSLSYGDNLFACPNEFRESKKLSIAESPLGDTQTLKSGITAHTTHQAETTERQASKTFTEKFIKTTAARFPKDLSFITPMKTLTTMIPQITNWSLVQTMLPITATNECLIQSGWLLPKRMSNPFDISQKNGTPQKREKNGTRRMPKTIGRLIQLTKSLALSAVSEQPSKDRLLANIALGHAARSTAENLDWMTSNSTANDAEKCSERVDSPSQNIAQSVVLRLRIGKREPVYNLQVEGCPEYFANGVLVHNCSYAINSYLQNTYKPDALIKEERIRELKESGMDDYSLNVHRMRLSIEMNKPAQSIKIGRRGRH